MPATYGRFNKKGLASTRCSYLTPDAVYKRGQSILGRMPIIIILFVVSLVIMFFLGAPNGNGVDVVPNILPYLAGDVLLFGALFVVGGWMEFRLMQTIDDIPTINIEGAAEGLNEINAQFIPETSNPLLSPMSKQNCIYYQATIEEYVHRGKNSYWIPCGEFSNGIPAMMTDGTGYLAVPLDEADININTTFYYPKNVKGQLVRSSTPEGRSLLLAFRGYLQDETLAGLGITFDRSEFGKLDLSLFSGNELRLTEIAIPTNKDYFAMGRITDTSSMFNSKPVKLMGYDSGTKLLTVRSESKSHIAKTDKTISFISLGLGVVMLLIGLAYFGLV